MRRDAVRAPKFQLVRPPPGRGEDLRGGPPPPSTRPARVALAFEEQATELKHVSELPNASSDT